jgi:exodeoxyribonuclease III
VRHRPGETGSERSMPRRPNGRPARGLRIATYNVNGVNGRLPRLLEWLAETAPDVVCLQELKTDDSKFPIDALRRAGYDALWHGQRSFHGVAILAKDERPAELRRGLPGDPSDVHTRYLEAEVKGLVVASIYLPNGNPKPSPNFDYKLRWFERFLHHARLLSTLHRPIVLAGDLNVVPTDFDIYNAYWWRFDAVMQPEVRSMFRALTAQGWIDAARHLHPHERIYTYWTSERAFAQNKGMRLDFVLVDPSLAGRLQRSGVDTEQRGRVKPSDHAPAWIELAD